MSSPLTNAEKNVWETINNFQGQLDSTFKSNQIVHDYAPLKGFLSFVDSKLTRMVIESLREQHAVYENADGTIDDKTVPLILRLYWEKICYPIFKWFQAWRKMLLPKTPKDQPKYVEFRRMNAKLTKFFKSTHKFYYNILEDLAARYDCSVVLPLEILKELNLHGKSSDLRIKLDSNNSFTIFIMRTLHTCLLYLGAAHRYKAAGEKVNNRYQVQDFQKSIRYLDLACMILPSIGEAYLQKGLIYVQTDNLGSATHQFIRSALARIPSRAARTNFATIIHDRNSQLHQKFDKILIDLNRQVSDKTRIVNREIIEYYFLALFATNFSPQTWVNPMREDCLQNGLQLNMLENTLNDTIMTRYIKNIDVLFEELITVIGGFDLLLISCRKGTENFDPRTTNLKDLKKNHLSYLAFAFNFITNMLNVIKESWIRNLEDYHYLAMVRVVECWLKSNRAALQYSHRDERFCKAFALLLNDILKSDMFDMKTMSTSKPARSYFFQEDIRLKEFFAVKNALADFDDTKIYSMEDSAARLMGFVPEDERLDALEEASLRLKAIVASGQKFLVKNSCGIVWNALKLVYEFSRPATKKAELVVVQKVEIKSARAEKKPSIAQRPKTLSVAELEEKLERTRQGSPQWGYSGSSAPMAPDSFKIKPSSDLTDSAQVVISEGSLNFNSSSSTLSSYSPRSENRVIEVSESQAPGTDKSQSNHVESIAPSKAPLQPSQPQIPQSLGSAAVFPPNMIYAPVQPGPFTQPMMYPQYGIPPYGQPPAPQTTQGFGQGYPPNWAVQQYFQQGQYPFIGQPQQPQYRFQGQPAAGQAAQFPYIARP